MGRAVAWGEMGLNFSWAKDTAAQQEQINCFERQLELAIARGLPLVLHLQESADEALRILLKCVPRHWKAHIHAQKGPPDFVAAILESFPNFYFGLTGSVCRGKHGWGGKMCEWVPLERMLFETD